MSPSPNSRRSLGSLAIGAALLLGLGLLVMLQLPGKAQEDGGGLPWASEEEPAAEQEPPAGGDEGGGGLPWASEEAPAAEQAAAQEEEGGGLPWGGATEQPAAGDEGDGALPWAGGEAEEAKAAVQAARPYPDAPPFQVRPRKVDLKAFPCTDCHWGEPLDRRERELTEEHTDIQFEHGGERFWCFTCHGVEQGEDVTYIADELISLKERPIDYNRAYLVCGQCHFQRQKDWYFGAHGKRVGAFPDQRDIPPTYRNLKVEARASIGRWDGERTLLSCPSCHDAHSPSIKPFVPSPPPPVRPGLNPPRADHPEHREVWQMIQQRREH